LCDSDISDLNLDMQQAVKIKTIKQKIKNSFKASCDFYETFD